MTEKFEDIFLKESGCSWSGKIRSGATGMTAVCRTLDDPETRFFKNRPKITAGAVDGFFVKRYNLPGFFTQLRRRFRRPRPFTVLAGAEKLAASGIATPKVYAAMVSRCGWCRKEYLVTGLLDDKCRMLNTLSETECRAAITGKFIAMLKVMHDTGMSHGDLSLRNCYISVDGKPGLLDLDGAVCGKVSNRRRTIELARIISSFLMQFRKMDDAEKFTDEVLKIYGGKVVAAGVLNAVEKFFQRGKKYL